MKEEGNAAFKACNWSSAHELYTQALEIDPCNKATNAKLYFNRATVAAKVRLFFKCQMNFSWDLTLHTALQWAILFS